MLAKVSKKQESGVFKDSRRGAKQGHGIGGVWRVPGTAGARQLQNRSRRTIIPGVRVSCTFSLSEAPLACCFAFSMGLELRKDF